MLTREELAVGLELPALEREVRQAQVDLYADAASDHNPIHINQDFVIPHHRHVIVNLYRRLRKYAVRFKHPMSPEGTPFFKETHHLCPIFTIIFFLADPPQYDQKHRLFYLHWQES